MFRLFTKTALCALVIALSLPLGAQKKAVVDYPITAADTLTLKNLKWNWHDLGKGAAWAREEIDLFGTRQCICIVRYPSSKFKTGVASGSQRADLRTTEEWTKRNMGRFGINGSFYSRQEGVPICFAKEKKKVKGLNTTDRPFRYRGMLLAKGNEVRIVRTTEDYLDVAKPYPYAICCGPVYLQDGKMALEPDMLARKGMGPLSCIGVDWDGNVWMIAVDGRAPGQAVGMNYAKAAWLCLQLGLKDVMNLDGGGSTTLWADEAGVINHPSDNKRFDHEGSRRVMNIIFAK